LGVVLKVYMGTLGCNQKSIINCNELGNTTRWQIYTLLAGSLTSLLYAEPDIFFD